LCRNNNNHSGQAQKLNTMSQMHLSAKQPSSTAFRTTTAIWTLLSIVAALVWIVALAAILQTYFAGKGFPLSNKFPAFEDITIYHLRFLLFHTAEFFKPHVHSRHFPYSPTAFAYPPAAALVYDAIYTFTQPVAFIVTLTILWTLFLYAATSRVLARHLPSPTLTTFYTATLLLFSFPLLFLLQRGNIELLVWILVTFSILAYIKNFPIAAAVLIGIAASIKLYPILLLGLFLSRRRNLPALLTGAATAIAATLFAMSFAGPTFSIAYNGFIDGVVRFKDQHAEAARAAEAVFDHSLFSPIKIQYLHQHGTPLQWSFPYYLIAGTLFLALFFLRIRKLPFLNRLIFLSVAMICLPPVSYEYTIVHLYLPLLILLIALLQSEYPPATSQYAALACFLFLMLPLALLSEGKFLLAGQLQAVALLTLAILSTLSPWQIGGRFAPIEV
jgi:hypothetical protein